VAGSRRLAAVMFTDMVGFTALTQADEAQALRVLERHAKLLRPVFPKHGGKEIKSAGDSFLVEFDSALEAVHCATAIQRLLHDYNRSTQDEWQITLRIGIHLGDVVHQNGDIFGDAVNIASRIEPLAPPEGVCLSQQVFDQVHNKFEFPLIALETPTLKNVRFPTAVYRVVMPWESALSSTGAPAMAALGASNRRVAVLPFANLSPDPGDEYFAEGITEEIISTISKIAELQVISRTSVARYKKETGHSASEIGRDLRAGSLLEGSVRKAGGRVRITAQLIDAPSDRHLWSESYERSLEDVFEIQREIAGHVADALRLALAPGEAARIRPPSTQNVEAHILALKGRAAQREATREGLEQSIQYYERALEKDPSYAAAVAGIADSYAQLGFFEYYPSREALAKARQFAERALGMDPTLIAARLCLGSVARSLDWDYDRAEAEFRKVIEQNPNSAEAHERLAILLSQAGRSEEAVREAARAVELEPLSTQAISTAGIVDLYARRYPQAITNLRAVLELEPRDSMAIHNLGLALVQAGQVEEGIAHMQRSNQLTKHSHAVMMMELIYAYTRGHREAEANELLARLLEGAKVNPGWSAAVAGAYASLGRNEEALNWLERAYDQHAGFLKAHLRNDFIFDPLRQEPRFQALLGRIGWADRPRSVPTTDGGFP
jgi:adenylate cyclase